ncbi:MAG: dTDP-4-amino-4,6-dideoxygalactose transaminase [Actinomycetes bacterium]|nr:dTDP-4-amino-4,6-dideoxygalactose transaminase [Actinomycetes bacterium]
MIPFNRPLVLGTELDGIAQVLRGVSFSGDGAMTKQCQTLLEQHCRVRKVLLTTSCSSALEMCALMLDLQPGDEVIMPSYTFVSTANAFVLHGATPVFIDIRPDTMNLDENLIEAAITPRTRAIVPVHYAGVSCEMDAICALAAEHGLAVIEDAAQGLMASYKGRPLGSMGEAGCLSFHETKNYHMGEGGALLLKNESFSERAEIIWQKGTNRAQFLNGQIDKYTWVDVGSSYLPGELNAAFLLPQLAELEPVNLNRLSGWRHYYDGLRHLQDAGLLELPQIPAGCEHNAHLFWVKCADLAERTALISHLRERGIQAVFHYVPLHSSPGGQQFGRFCGEDRFTTVESERLVRLPLFYGLKQVEIDRVVTAIESFFKDRRNGKGKG